MVMAQKEIGSSSRTDNGANHQSACGHPDRLTIARWAGRGYKAPEWNSGPAVADEGATIAGTHRLLLCLDFGRAGIPTDEKILARRVRASEESRHHKGLQYRRLAGGSFRHRPCLDILYGHRPSLARGKHHMAHK